VLATLLVVREDPSAASALRFAELYQRLVELGLLRNRASLLYLLFAVSEQKSAPKVTSVFGLSI